jgi:uncharacterized protein (DUF1330 family)
MSAYFLLQIEWTNDAARRSYIDGIAGMVEKHGGEFIVSSTDYRVAEGAWRPGRLVAIRFPTMAAVSAWYGSEEYRPLRELRLKNSRSDAVLVEGD